MSGLLLLLLGSVRSAHAVDRPARVYEAGFGPDAVHGQEGDSLAGTFLGLADPLSVGWGEELHGQSDAARSHLLATVEDRAAAPGAAVTSPFAVTPLGPLDQPITAGPAWLLFERRDLLGHSACIERVDLHAGVNHVLPRQCRALPSLEIGGLVGVEQRVADRAASTTDPAAGAPGLDLGGRVSLGDEHLRGFLAGETGSGALEADGILRWGVAPDLSAGLLGRAWLGRAAVQLDLGAGVWLAGPAVPWGGLGLEVRPLGSPVGLRAGAAWTPRWATPRLEAGLTVEGTLWRKHVDPPVLVRAAGNPPQ